MKERQTYSQEEIEKSILNGRYIEEIERQNRENEKKFKLKKVND